MPKTIPELLIEANERLRLGGIKLRIELRGGKLGILGTLPRKDGEGRKQQRISLGLDATPYGLKEAERQLLEVWLKLEHGTFVWSDYLRKVDKPDLVGTLRYWLKRYQLTWETRQIGADQRREQIIDSWARIEADFAGLDKDAPLNVDSMIKILETYPVNSAIRARRFTFFAAVLNIANVPDAERDRLRKHKGTYGLSSVAPRYIPSDAEIEECRLRLTEDYSGKRSKGFRMMLRCYDLMACYGLRNHECFFCEVESEPPYRLRVLEGKTGSRYPVLPIHREWAEQWKPWREVKYNFGARSNVWFGNWLAKNFIYYQLPFPAYSLRHAYAIRARVFYRIPDTVSARMMGHSVEMHNKIYHQWISESQIQDIYELAMFAKGG